MIYFLIFILVSSFSFPVSTIAQTPSESPTENIQTIREVVQQKVKEKLKQISNPTSLKKAIIGKVIQIDSSSATVEYQGVTRKLAITTETTFVSNVGAKITLDKIKIGQDIIAMGTITENDILDAKRIVSVDLKKVLFSRTTVVGKIADLCR